MVSKRRDSKDRSSLSTKWLKVEEYEVLGFELEVGKLAFAVMADPATCRYVRLGLRHFSQGIRERLWKRVQEHAGPAPQGMKRPATQWVKPGIIGRVKHLRGEEDLRHASLQDFREE